MLIEDENGNRTIVTQAYWDRWPSVRETFRPVADEPTTTVVTTSPTGENEKE